MLYIILQSDNLFNSGRARNNELQLYNDFVVRQHATSNRSPITHTIEPELFKMVATSIHVGERTLMSFIAHKALNQTLHPLFSNWILYWFSSYQTKVTSILERSRTFRSKKTPDLHALAKSAIPFAVIPLSVSHMNRPQTNTRKLQNVKIDATVLFQCIQ